jgi:hypothetical protein
MSVSVCLQPSLDRSSYPSPILRSLAKVLQTSSCPSDPALPPPPRLRLPTSNPNQSPAPKAKPRPCLAWAPPLTHLRRLGARAGCWGLREKDRVGWEKRGEESPTLVQVAHRGGMGSLRRRQPDRCPDLGAQRWRLHLHQGLHLRRDRPPRRAPPITAISPLPSNFRSHSFATGDWAKHRAPPSRGDC